MAKISPYNGNYQAYASNEVTNKRTVFGSSSESPIYSDTLDGNMVTAYFKGWDNASAVPPMQYFNGALFTATQTLAYIFQNLALPWVTGQEKYVGQLAKGSDNKTYICLIDNTTVDPVGDLTSTWETYGFDEFVVLAGDQTIAGVKTFSSSPIVPTATTGLQAINKDQLDNYAVRDYVDETSNRLRNTVYTNNTGKEIILYITVQRTTNGQYNYDIQVDGVDVFVFVLQNTNGDTEITGAVHVPVGSTYELQLSTDTDFVITRWLEYK